MASVALHLLGGLACSTPPPDAPPPPALEPAWERVALATVHVDVNMPTPVEHSRAQITDAAGNALDVEELSATRDGGATVFTASCTTTPRDATSAARLDTLRANLRTSPGLETLAERDVQGSGWTGWRARHTLARGESRFESETLVLVAGEATDLGVVQCQLQVLVDPAASRATQADRDRFLGSVRLDDRGAGPSSGP